MLTQMGQKTGNYFLIKCHGSFKQLNWDDGEDG